MNTDKDGNHGATEAQSELTLQDLMLALEVARPRAHLADLWVEVPGGPVMAVMLPASTDWNAIGWRVGGGEPGNGGKAAARHSFAGPSGLGNDDLQGER